MCARAEDRGTEGCDGRSRGAGHSPAPFPFLTLGLAALAIALYGLPGTAEWLAYERQAVAAGELWRGLTAHWVHWSPDHLVWDVATFVALGAASELRSRTRFAVCLLGSGLAIGALVHWGLTGLSHYGGLSGIDCALFALLGAELWREQRRAGRRFAPALALGLGLALALKLGVEWTTGGAMFVSDLGAGVSPVPAAHLAGAAVGLAVPLLAASTGSPRGEG